MHFFHASGLPAELFFCVPQLVLSRDICLEALGQSAPGTPTKAGPVLLCRHPLRNAWSGCVILCQAAPVGKLLWHNTAMTPAGLEPAIPSSVGRCLIHWATGPLSARHRISDAEVTHLGGRKGKAVGLKPALPGSLGRRFVHWAAGPLAERIRISNHASDLPGWRQRPSMRVTPPP